MSSSPHAGGEVERNSDDHRLLNRIAEVRQSEGQSLSMVARQLNLDLATAARQEDPACDMLLSTLYTWAAAMNVPAAELLFDQRETLAAPVLQRAMLVRIMKTVVTIRQRSDEPGIRRLAETLAEQLCELMPELREVAPWHLQGRPRSRDDLGQAALRGLALDLPPHLTSLGDTQGTF